MIAPYGPSDHRPPGVAATRAAATFFLVGVTWVVASDLLLANAGEMTPSGLRVAVAKGVTFVLLTTGLVFWMVRREVAAAARRSSMLRAITEGTDDAVFVKDGSGRYLLFNSAAARLVGKPVADVLGRDDTALFDPFGASLVMARDRRVMADGRTETVEETLTADGVTRTYLATKAPYRDDTGAVVGVVGVSRDVTESRRAESALRESEQRFRELADAAPVLIWLSDTTKGCVWFNRRWLEFVGRSLEREVGAGWVDGVHPDDRDRCTELYSAAFDAREPFVMEYRLRRHDGKYRWVLDTGAPRTTGGVFAGYIGSCVDITDRKRAEDLLRDGEARYRTLAENTSDAILLHRADGVIVDANTAACDMLGRTYAELVGLPPLAFDPGASPDRMTAIHAGLDARTSVAFDTVHHRKDGSTFPVEVRIRPFRSGGVQYAISTVRDITDRKRAEDALRRSEARLADAQRVARLGSWEWHPATGQVWWSDAIYDLFGLAVGSVSPSLEAFLDRLHPDDRARGLARAEAMIAGGTEFSDDLRVVRPDGTVLWIHSRARVTRDAGGRVVRVEGTDQDITDRKRTEEELRSNQQRLRLAQAILDAAGDNILVCDAGPLDSPGPRILYANPSFLKNTGYSLDEVIGQTPRILQGPKTDRATLDRIRAALRAWQPVRVELINYRKDGSEFWVELNITPLADETGWFTHWISIQRDITDRKRAEEVLAEREERFRFLIDGMDVGVVLQDNADRILLGNPAAAELLGLTPDQLLGRTSRDPSWGLVREDGSLLPADEVPSVVATRTGQPVRNRVVGVLRPSAGQSWLEVSAFPRVDPADGQTMVLVTLIDVTAQKEAAQALRLARFSIERAVEAMFWITPSGRIEYANEAAHRMLGYAAGELTGKTVPEIDPNFPADAWPAHWAEVTRRGSFTFESDHRTQGGRPILTEVTVNYLRHEDREYNCAVMRDVTDRKVAEAALRASEERLRLALQAGRMGTFDWDVGTGRVVWSDTHFDLWGYPPDERPAVDFGTFLGRVHPADRDEVQAVIEQARGDRRPYRLEHRLLLPSGEVRWIAGRGEFKYSAAGEPVRMLGTVQDVTDRKQAELGLAASERRYRDLADAIPQIVWTADRTGAMTHLNAQVAEYTGLPATDLEGWSWERVIHPEDLPALVAAWAEVIRTAVPQPLEFRIRRADGAYRWHFARQTPGFDAAGELVGWYGTCTDVEDMKATQAALRASEEQLKLAIRASGVVIWDWDATADAQVWRTEGPDCFGWTEPMERPHPARWWSDRVHPDDRDRATAAFFAAVAAPARQAHQDEYRFRRADGGYADVLDYAYILRDADGRAVRAVGALLDVTDRRRSERAVRESEERLRIALTAAAAVGFVWDAAADSVVRYFSTVPTLPVNTDAPEPVAAVRARVHPDDAAVFDAGVEACLREGTEYRNLYRVLEPDGSVRWLEEWGRLARTADGRPRRLTGISIDVTDRKRSEEALRASEERYRRLIELLPVGVFVMRAGRITYANPAYARTTGAADGAALLGRDTADALHPDSRPLVAAAMAEMRASGGAGRPLDLQARRVDGTYYSAYAVAMPLGPEEVLTVVVDTSDRERSDRLMQSLLASVGDAILTVDDRGVVWVANPATERLFGYPAAELIGGNVSVLMPQPHRSQHDRYIAEYLRTGRAQVIGVGRELVGRKKDGTEFPIEVTLTELRLGDERHFTGVIRDLTARKQLEEQFRQAQKMEAIGRLAGGVAHDFNNLLTVINGYADLLLFDLPPDHPQRPAVSAVRDAGDRAAALTAQLLAFSRRTIVTPKVFDLRDAITQAERLLRRLIGEDVTLTVVSYAAPCRVHADPAQIDQVILNLAVNARDAMPTGGRLTLETRRVTLPEGAGGPDLTPGDYIELTVSDTGCGMTDEVRARVFEPFFTTKGVGHGTGLGLATVHGIVHQAGGHVGVTSRVGHGTTFRVLLPAVEVAAPTDQPAAPDPAAGRGAETVLLVEDDDAVRTLCTLALESHGYTVLAAESGAHALDLLRADPGRVDVLVSDVVMPEMSGRELVTAASAITPGLLVLFVSGYTDDAVFRHGVREATDHFLQKPFSPLALARKVREMLDGR